MGSRIMHLIIADRIADCLQIEDRVPFLIGGVAPDAVSAKDESHFFKGEHHNFTRCIDYGGFLQKYSSPSAGMYVLGYYTHLIADDQWLKGFYLPWLRNRMQADPNLYQTYHQDFRLLNGRLLEHYGLKDALSKKLTDVPAVPDLEEVESKDIEAFIPHLRGDLEYDRDALNEELQVFTLVQIIGYIETSVQVALLKLGHYYGKA